MSEKSTGKIVASLPDESKRLIGRAILEGLKSGGFNPIAAGDYTQGGNSNYAQQGGGNYNQAGNGNHNQTALTGKLGELDITDLAQILASVEKFER